MTGPRRRALPEHKRIASLQRELERCERTAEQAKNRWEAILAELEDLGVSPRPRRRARRAEVAA